MSPQFYIGQQVQCRTHDTFNNKVGRVDKVLDHYVPTVFGVVFETSHNRYWFIANELVAINAEDDAKYQDQQRRRAHAEKYL